MRHLLTEIPTPRLFSISVTPGGDARAPVPLTFAYPTVQRCVDSSNRYCRVGFSLRRASARLLEVALFRYSRAEALRRLKPTLQHYLVWPELAFAALSSAGSTTIVPRIRLCSVQRIGTVPG